MGQSDTIQRYGLYYGGKWHEPQSKETFPTINPYTQKPWAEISQANEADVTAAIAAARHAFVNTWRDTPGIQRTKLLNRLAELLEARAEEMGKLETTDNGKVVRETHSQMFFAARQYRFAAGYADKLFGQVIPLDRNDVFDYATYEPLGVVALITAWNSPMALLGNKLGGALAAGCTVVVKPSEHASVTTLEFCKLIEEAGFPPGVFNVVTGDHRTGAALVDGDINKVSFTGSPNVGRIIASAAGKRLVPLALELGGKSPNIIFDDADINKATVGALAGIFGATGQTCIAGSRLLVQRPVYDEVVERLIKRAEQIKMGNPLDKATEMGTVANEPQFNRIMSFVESAKSEGASLVTGGERAVGGDLDSGLFIRPTIFANVRNDMKLAQEEIFGPVLSIIPFETEEEAIQMANDTKYGLASGVWTQNLNRALRVTRVIHAGVVWVNTYRAVSAQAPFGGFKDSGYGRERGQAGILEFMAIKNVMMNFSEEDRDPFALQT